jgi:hypothetical protein
VKPASLPEGKSLGKPFEQLGPDLVLAQDPYPGAGQRLHVGRKALLGPSIVRRQVRKGEVDHLVGEHPVVVQVARASVAPHVDADRGDGAAARHAVANAASAAGAHRQANAGDRIAAEVGGHAAGGVLGPA